MTPGSFDPVTSREMVGDQRSRSIEAKARADADAGRFDPPAYSENASYWGQAQDEFARRVYIQQHERRTARNLRKG